MHTNPMFKAALGAAGMAAIVTLAGCASPPNNDRTDLVEAGDGWPALDDKWYDGGKFVEPEAILRIRETQSKHQVRQLLGDPHFSEGFFGVREWDYVFNLYTGEGNDYLTCQYKVIYDDDMALESTHWRDQQCPALLVPIEVEEVEEERLLTLSGDVLFDFDSDELTLEGRRALDRVAQQTLTDFTLPGLMIAGYTDRFGSEDYNMRLSQSRADTVAGYLSEQGIMRRNIDTIGRGDADPVVECSGTRATAAVTECLRPNRRVEITVNELQR
ncbi:OmpA family protein [Halomonas sp. TBZ9]|uniref:OmpA family protein n=1 Tax=Vreelandella azerica TaxID=2732867 RepID=A0A7Y3TWJ4_9GAMM|nr:OmpA family protein [Halomonas azerica]NOG31359.1 OmpA family protein [Halomonas azerica]